VALVPFSVTLNVDAYCQFVQAQNMISSLQQSQISDAQILVLYLASFVLSCFEFSCLGHASSEICSSKSLYCLVEHPFLSSNIIILINVEIPLLYIDIAVMCMYGSICYG
jgi:hypothetical protein